MIDLLYVVLCLALFGVSFGLLSLCRQLMPATSGGER